METLQSSLVCRLCGVESVDSTVISIFDNNQGYPQKIHTVLPIYVHRHEPMPKNMCHDCCEKLDLTYNFYMTVIKTDNKFKEKLCWMQKRTKKPSRINGVPMVALKNFNIKTEVEETAESTDPSKTNELIKIVQENTSQNDDDDDDGDCEILSPPEINNNSHQDDDDDDDSLKAKKTIESIKKNLFSSPRAHAAVARKNPIRPRDIENEIHDRRVQSNFVLESSPSEISNNLNIEMNLRKNVLSPVVLLKSKSMFENRSPLRRPRNSLANVTRFRKTDNQNVANIVRMLKTDSKLRDGLQVKIDRLDIGLLNGKNKTLADNEGNEEQEGNGKRNLRRTVRISRKGSVQRPKSRVVVKKKCFTNGNEIKRNGKVVEGKINGVADDDVDGEEFKFQCKMCPEKFVNREMFQLHPCYNL